VDTESGLTVAAIDGQGFGPETTWVKLAEDQSPILVISTGSKLSAFRVIPGR